MLIFLKYSIKTSFLILLFITAVNYLYAANTLHDRSENNGIASTSIQGIDDGNMQAAGFISILKDTIAEGQNDTKKEPDNGNIPAELFSTPINFQINSYIYYLNIGHFVNANAQKSFIEGLLKEKQLHRLSLHADSLRKAYATASDEQREKISAEIIQTEQQSLVLNEEIPSSYEKAREEENLYWQSASMDKITQFQQKIRQYEDSLARSRQQALHTIVPDTIIMDVPIQNYKEPEPAAEVPTGIIYKIQIGAYKGKIPDTANKLIKKISLIRKVENHVDEKGVKVYTTGNLRTFAEAETMLAQVKQEGIKNAVITSYQNGKKITVTEARKLNKEL